jgi:hypothetical protein
VSQSQANLFPKGGSRRSMGAQRSMALISVDSDTDDQAELVPAENVAKKGEMDLKIMSSVVFWEQRIVTLTNQELFLSKPTDPDKVSARVSLHDVLNVFVEGEGPGEEEEAAAAEGYTLVIRTDPLGSSFG